MAEDLDPNDPEVRLSQFLYVGKEYPDYQPGNWFIHKYFLPKNVPSIEELAEDSEKNLLPVDIIKKAFESNLVPNPETLVFALAVCCRQRKTNLLRQAAYLAVDKICVSPQHFILFIKFAYQIKKDISRKMSKELRKKDKIERIKKLKEIRQKEIEKMRKQKEMEQMKKQKEIEQMSEQKEIEQMSEQKEIEQMSEQKEIEQMSEQKEIEQMSEQKEIEQMSEKKEIEQMSEQKEIEQMSEQKEIEQMSEQKEIEQMSEQKEIEQMSEQKEIEQMSEQKEIEQISEQKEIEQMSEQKEIEQMSEQKEIEQMSEQKEIEQMSEQKEIEQMSEQKEIEQMSEQKEIEQMSEQKETEQTSKKTTKRKGKKPIKENKVDEGSGWGCGLRKTVRNWYFSKPPMELAKCVTRYRSRYGWKHKDIIKLCHPAPNNPEREMIFKYVMRGLKVIKKSSIEDPTLMEILKYIEHVENFKHCTNEVEAADLLKTYKLTLDDVPGHLLKSEEIWTALIPSMNLVMLLTNLQRIHNFKLLKPGSPIVSKIIKQITNKENIARDKVHPILIFVTIRTYENSGKPLTCEKMKLFNKPLLTPSKPNSKIIDALYKMWNISFFHVQSTDLRYMITISMNKAMLETHTWRNNNINGAEAGCMIALALLRSEKNVTVATFKNGGVYIEKTIQKNVTFNQLMKKLQEMPVGTINLGKPMLWAGNKNYKYDVFINIVDQIYEQFDTSEEALQEYNTKLELKNTKLINCAVCSSSTYRKQKSNKNILTMNGFDASTPVVIQAFVKSLF